MRYFASFLFAMICVLPVTAKANEDMCASAAERPQFSGVYTSSTFGPIWFMVNERFIGITGGRLVQKANSYFEVCYVDNQKRFIVAKNTTKGFGQDKLYSRFDWYVDPDTSEIFFCRWITDAKTPEEAANAPGAIIDDPDDGGCNGGVPWWSVVEQYKLP